MWANQLVDCAIEQLGSIELPNVLACVVSSASSPSGQDTPAWGCKTGCLCSGVGSGKGWSISIQNADFHLVPLFSAQYCISTPFFLSGDFLLLVLQILEGKGVQIFPSLASESLFRYAAESVEIPVDNMLAIHYDKIFQDQLLSSLPQSWSQTCPQGSQFLLVENVIWRQNFGVRIFIAAERIIMVGHFNGQS